MKTIDLRFEKPEKCEKCQFFRAESAKYEFPDNPKLVIVGESLGYREVQEGSPFVGKSGAFLNTLLSFFDLTRDQVHVTNAIKCFPGAGKNKEKIKKPSIKKCLSIFLSQELEETNPTPVLVLGDHATYAITFYLFGKGRTIKELDGRVIQKDGRKYAFMRHPSFYMRRYGEGKAEKEFYNHGKKLLKALFSDGAGDLNFDDPPLPFTYHVGESHLLSFLSSLPDNEILIFDIETNGLHFTNKDMEITLIGVSDTRGNIFVNKPSRKIIDGLSRFRLVAHNGKFDINFIRAKYGIRLNLYFDTLLAGYAIDQGRKEYSLESLTYTYAPDAALWRGTTKSKKKASTLDFETLVEYNAIDVYATYRLYQELSPKLESSFFFWEILMPATDIFADVEFHGAYVDIERLRYIGNLCLHLKSVVERDIRSLPEVNQLEEERGTKYNPRSSQHNLFILQQIKKLQYTDPRTKKTYLIPSSNKKILARFKDDRFCSLLLKYRKYQKASSTYAKGIEKKLIPTKYQNIFRGYPSFFLHRTATGRTASGSLLTDSASPITRTKDDISFNFQNFPRGRLIRGMIIPPPGYIIVSFDYSTLEMRIAAGIANEQHLIKAFMEGLDFHTYMASLTFDVPYEEVTKEQRQLAKTVSFGLLYGASPLLLVENFGISEERAYEIYDRYFSSVPNIKAWIDSTIAFIEEHHYVETPFGRRRYFYDLSNNAYKREGPNMVVQSVASDLMLITLSLIKKELLSLSWWEREVIFFCAVHDSASFYIKEDQEVIEKAIDIFIDCAMLKVARIPEVARVLSGCPLLIDFKVGKRWE